MVCISLPEQIKDISLFRTEDCVYNMLFFHHSWSSCLKMSLKPMTLLFWSSQYNRSITANKAALFRWKIQTYCELNTLTFKASYYYYSWTDKEYIVCLYSYVSCLKNTSKNSVFTCVFSSITSYVLNVFAFFVWWYIFLSVFIDADLMCPVWNEKCEVPLLVQTILSILEIEVQPKSFGDPAEPGGLLQIQSTFLMYFFLV